MHFNEMETVNDLSDAQAIRRDAVVEGDAVWTL
jgi:hypothetical protein